MHERSDEGTYGAAFRRDPLHIAPVDIHAHVIIAAAMLSVRQAVPAPGAQPPFFVLSPELTTNDCIACFQELHEQSLTGSCECIKPYIRNLNCMIVESIIIFPIGKVLQMLTYQKELKAQKRDKN